MHTRTEAVIRNLYQVRVDLDSPGGHFNSFEGESSPHHFWKTAPKLYHFYACCLVSVGGVLRPRRWPYALAPAGPPCAYSASADHIAAVSCRLKNTNSIPQASPTTRLYRGLRSYAIDVFPYCRAISQKRPSGLIEIVAGVACIDYSRRGLKTRTGRHRLCPAMRPLHTTSGLSAWRSMNCVRRPRRSTCAVCVSTEITL